MPRHPPPLACRSRDTGTTSYAHNLACLERVYARPCAELRSARQHSCDTRPTHERHILRILISDRLNKKLGGKTADTMITNQLSQLLTSFSGHIRWPIPGGAAPRPPEFSSQPGSLAGRETSCRCRSLVALQHCQHCPPHGLP